MGLTGLLMAAALFGCAFGQWEMIQQGTVSQMIPAYAAAILAVAAGVCCAVLYGPQLVNEGVSCSQPLLYLANPLFCACCFYRCLLNFPLRRGHTLQFLWIWCRRA